MRKYVILAILITLIAGLPAHAENFLQKVRIHGFLSQAFMTSNKNNFLAPTREGSFEFNEVGVTLSTNPVNRLRLGIQFLSRDLGPVGNNKLVLDWAFADYHFNDYFGLRFGKVKMPYGLYNEGRDTDLLRPMAWLPQSVYAEAYRGYMVAYQGVGAYGNIAAGPAGDADYHVFYGTANIGEDETLLSYMRGVFDSLSPLTGVPVKRLQMDTKILIGGSLIWNTPLTGLRLGFSNLHYKGYLKTYSEQPSFGHLDVKWWQVYSLEFTHGNLTVAGEYMERRNTLNAFGMELEDVISQGYYGMISYLINGNITLSVLYDVYYDRKDDKEGKYLVMQGLPDYLAWRKDFAASLRYDPNSHWTFKAEWHTINGASLFLRMYNPEGIQKNWTYLILKSSFNF